MPNCVIKYTVNCLFLKYANAIQKEVDKKYAGTNGSTFLGKHTHDFTQSISSRIWSNKALNIEGQKKAVSYISTVLLNTTKANREVISKPGNICNVCASR